MIACLGTWIFKVSKRKASTGQLKNRNRNSAVIQRQETSCMMRKLARLLLRGNVDGGHRFALMKSI
jgi:hypothetical protein